MCLFCLASIVGEVLKAVQKIQPPGFPGLKEVISIKASMDTTMPSGSTPCMSARKLVL